MEENTKFDKVFIVIYIFKIYTHSLNVNVYCNISFYLFVYLRFFSLSLFLLTNLGYKPYMYISPMTEQMRRRKSFAAIEFERNGESHVFASSVASSSVSNLTPSYDSRLSMQILPQNEHLSNIIDYHALQSTTMAASENNNMTEYFSATAPVASINDYQSSELLHSKSPSSSSLSTSPPLSSPHLPSFLFPTPPSQHKIRIIDDAKLMYMRRQIDEPSLIHNQLTAQQHNSQCTTNAKPKLSFSIESIIGIK